MADEVEGRSGAERGVGHGVDVGAEPVHPMAVLRRRYGAAAHAPEVEGDHSVVRGESIGHQVPGAEIVRIAVHEEHRWSVGGAATLDVEDRCTGSDFEDVDV